MTSGYEHSEVAKRLRWLDVEITSHDTLEKAVDKLMKAVYGERPFSPVRYSVRNLCGLGCVLADLIDQTGTNEIVRDGLAVWHRCSMCEEPLDSHVNYCPNCGARLVDE